MRDNYDRVVAKFAKENNLPLEYYPKINTKSGLDTQQPELLSKLLKENKFTPIRSMTQFKKVISNRNRTQYIENVSAKYIDNILKSLCIDNNHPIQTKNGVKIIVDNEFDRKILISPPSVRNIHYVMVRPNSVNRSTERFAIDSDGNILQSYKTPEGIKKFGDRFKELMVKNI